MEFERELKRVLDAPLKPAGALGRLERVASQVARLQSRLSPVMSHATLMVIAADHGIADDGVSAFQPGATRQMLEQAALGRSVLNTLAGEAGMELRLVDAGIAGAALSLDGVEDHRIGPGTASFLTRPAMRERDCARAMEIGQSLGNQAQGQCLALGEMARGSSSSASLIIHRLTGVPLEGLVGRGAGLDEEGLFRKHEILTKAATRAPRGLDARQVVAEFGGFEIAMMVGAMIGAAKAGRLVLVDGYVAAAAALVAAQLVPECRSAMVFAHLSREPGHRVALEALATQPLLQLDVALGQGVGAALAWPMIRSSASLLAQLAGADGTT